VLLPNFQLVTQINISAAALELFEIARLLSFSDLLLYSLLEEHSILDFLLEYGGLG
jgi:hypothetical protein